MENKSGEEKERIRLLADFITETEWEMFRNVTNIGGRASCQDQRETFEIMRKSQFLAWNETSLASYLEDLMQALAEGRNLPAEKYAWMMEKTDPEQFEKIRGMLPEISLKKRTLAEKISFLHLKWTEECRTKYPCLFRGARPVYTRYDSRGAISSETYWLGELLTFSEKTLERYLDYAMSIHNNRGNLCEEILSNTMKAYGFSSLEDAENHERKERADGSGIVL